MNGPIVNRTYSPPLKDRIEYTDIFKNFNKGDLMVGVLSALTFYTLCHILLKNKLLRT